MKRAGKIIAVVVGGYLGLMLISGLAIKFFLSGGRLPGLLSNVGAEMPVPVELGEGDFDLLEWFRFRPSISLDKLRVGNPSGYSADPMLEAERLSAQVSLGSLFGDEVRVLSFTIHQPVLTIEANSAGKTNIEALLELAPDPGEEATEALEAPEGTSVAVDQLLITSGTLRYQGQGMPGLVIDDVNIALSDFSEARASNVRFDAHLFDSDDSVLAFEGRGGPYSKSSLPAEGSLSVVLAPAEMPAEIRRTYFGDLLGEPGGDSRVRLEVDAKGDLLGAFRGDGKLVFSDLMIGRDGDHQLAFEGEAPLRLDSQKLLATPSVRLISRNASLRLGEGEWKGQVTLGYSAPNLLASSSGSIAGVQVNELLGAFTTAEDAVYGVATIPGYSISGSGKDAEELRNALTGQGSIDVAEGRVALFDLVGTIERHAKKLLGGETAAEGETSFVRLSSTFDIGGQRINLSDVRLEGKSANVRGQGYITFDQELHLDLNAGIRGSVAKLVGGAPDGDGVPVAAIPVTIRGTVESPKVRPAIGKIAVKKALGLFESLFQKEEEEEEAGQAPQTEP